MSRLHRHRRPSSARRGGAACPHDSGRKPTVAGAAPPATSGRQPATSGRKPATSSRQPATSSRHRATDSSADGQAETQVCSRSDTPSPAKVSAGTAPLWQVLLNNRESSPITAGQLRALVLQGKVTADTPVRRQGMENFVRACKVKGLFDQPPAPPPAAPAPAAAVATSAPQPAPAAPVVASSLPPDPTSDAWDRLDTEDLGALLQ